LRNARQEIKALIEVDTTMGYEGEELKQFVVEDRKKSEENLERETAEEGREEADF